MSRRVAENSPFLRRRCLIPADGFFEWDNTKQPYFIRVFSVSRHNTP